MVNFVPLKRIHDVFVSHIMYSDLFVNETEHCDLAHEVLDCGLINDMFIHWHKSPEPCGPKQCLFHNGWWWIDCQSYILACGLTMRSPWSWIQAFAAWVAWSLSSTSRQNYVYRFIVIIITIILLCKIYTSLLIFGLWSIVVCYYHQYNGSDLKLFLHIIV